MALSKKKNKKEKMSFPTGKNEKFYTTKNGAVNPRSKSYDHVLATRRKKEKNRRKINQLNRKRRG